MQRYPSPSAIGARAEAAVASALIRAGRAVFLPAFAAHGRVDLVYLAEARIVRLQCKSARLMGETVCFRTCSNTSNIPKIYGDEIDEFGVYSPDTGLVYLVPATDLPTRRCALRLSPTQNGQRTGVRWARDYELGPP